MTNQSTSGCTWGTSAAFARRCSRSAALLCSFFRFCRRIPIRIPAATFQLKRASGHNLFHGPTAFRTILYRIISHSLLHFVNHFTSWTLIFVNWHFQLRLYVSSYFREGIDLAQINHFYAQHWCYLNACFQHVNSWFSISQKVHHRLSPLDFCPCRYTIKQFI